MAQHFRLIKQQDGDFLYEAIAPDVVQRDMETYLCTHYSVAPTMTQGIVRVEESENASFLALDAQCPAPRWDKIAEVVNSITEEGLRYAASSVISETDWSDLPVEGEPEYWLRERKPWGEALLVAVLDSFEGHQSISGLSVPAEKGCVMCDWHSKDGEQEVQVDREPFDDTDPLTELEWFLVFQQLVHREQKYAFVRYQLAATIWLRPDWENLQYLPGALASESSKEYYRLTEDDPVPAFLQALLRDERGYRDWATDELIARFRELCQEHFPSLSEMLEDFAEMVAADELCRDLEGGIDKDPTDLFLSEEERSFRGRFMGQDITQAAPLLIADLKIDQPKLIGDRWEDLLADAFNYVLEIVTTVDTAWAESDFSTLALRERSPRASSSLILGRMGHGVDVGDYPEDAEILREAGVTTDKLSSFDAGDISAGDLPLMCVIAYILDERRLTVVEQSSLLLVAKNGEGDLHFFPLSDLWDATEWHDGKRKHLLPVEFNPWAGLPFAPDSDGLFTAYGETYRLADPEDFLEEVFQGITAAFKE